MSSTLPAEVERSLRARFAEAERECELTYEDRRTSGCGKVTGELRVERLKSYEEALDMGEATLLWRVGML